MWAVSSISVNVRRRFGMDRLYRACRRRAQHSLALAGVRGWLVPECLRPVQPEDDAPGFVSYALLDMRDGTLMSISVFESRLELDAGNQIISAWIADHLPTCHQTPASTEIGEIILQRGM
jgi:hypothetical protein